MDWVEKSSLEKIRRLLEIFEQECHYKVLLTRDNIYVVRRNPAPYTLSIIPRPLSSDIVEGEHFVIADIRRLISSSARPSEDPVVEASSRVQGFGHASGSSTSLSRDSSSAHLDPSRRIRSSRPERLPLLIKWPGLPPEWYRSDGKGHLGNGTRSGPRVRISFPGLVSNTKVSRIWRKRNWRRG